VHKFSSCDGCQLAFLNLGESLLQLSEQVEILHFLEAGMSEADAQVDIAFVEGSLSTPDELELIQQVRKSSRYLVSIGACATSGGLQACVTWMVSMMHGEMRSMPAPSSYRP